MTEELHEMEARHAAERAELVRRLIEQAWRSGTEGRPPCGKASLRLINEAVAEEHGFVPADLLTKTRVCNEIAHARFAAFHRAHQCGFTLSAIGNYYHRDHSSVMHGIKRHKEITAEKNGVAVQ